MGLFFYNHKKSMRWSFYLPIYLSIYLLTSLTILPIQSHDTSRFAFAKLLFIIQPDEIHYFTHSFFFLFYIPQEFFQTHRHKIRVDMFPTSVRTIQDMLSFPYKSPSSILNISVFIYKGYYSKYYHYSGTSHQTIVSSNIHTRSFHLLRNSYVFRHLRDYPNTHHTVNTFAVSNFTVIHITYLRFLAFHHNRFDRIRFIFISRNPNTDLHRSTTR